MRYFHLDAHVLMCMDLWTCLYPNMFVHMCEYKFIYLYDDLYKGDLWTKHICSDILINVSKFPCKFCF